ncbi:hypothetical protein CHARACLAT_032215 [Characodon lateralis]|uniref:Uncharacterized protein n=1 Tax=Characodon lateralis TaxID=208331 RepID=A0ABU7DNR1_9TELE|nr:hypothetical protein [Characodon lateralis]
MLHMPLQFYTTLMETNFTMNGPKSTGKQVLSLHQIQLSQAQIQNQVMFAGRKSLEPHNRDTVPQHHLHLPSSHPPNDREQVQVKGAGGETCMDTAITELLTKGYFLV